MGEISYEEFEKELFEHTKEIGIETKYVDKSNDLEKIRLKYEQDCLGFPFKKPIIFQNEKNKLLEKVIKRAIFLEGIYNEAMIQNIPPKYIDNQVKGKTLFAMGCYSLELPDLGKMGEKERKKIIKNAKKMNKKARKLESKIYLISSLLIILLSLFLFSPNFTGKIIGNFQSLTNNFFSIFLLFCRINLCIERNQKI